MDCSMYFRSKIFSVKSGMLYSKFLFNPETRMPIVQLFKSLKMICPVLALLVFLGLNSSFIYAYGDFTDVTASSKILTCAVPRLRLQREATALAFAVESRAAYRRSPPLSLSKIVRIPGIPRNSPGIG